MKKILSIFIAMYTLVFTTFNVSATNTISSKKSSTKLRFDMATRTVQEVDDDLVSETESYTSRTFDGEYSPEYSVDSLDNDSIINPQYLLGNWDAINPATGGQYRNTVFILVTAPNGSSHAGTGFMIGPSAVATAAHVVYNTNFGGDNYIESGKVYPAFADGSTPYGSAAITEIVLYNAWTEDHDIEYDWAIIELNSNIGNNVGWLGLKYQSDSYNGTSISINGYPSTVNGNLNRIMYRSDGTITGSYTRLLRSTNTNLFEGMSGGPVYIYSSNSGYTAIAIATSAVKTSSGSKYNRFVRITQEVYTELIKYRNKEV